MSDDTLWKNFEKTGDIVDYLSYKGIHFHDAPLGKTEMGDRVFEPKNHGDRNDTIRNTYR